MLCSCMHLICPFQMPKYVVLYNGNDTKTMLSRDHLLLRKKILEWLFIYSHSNKLPRCITVNDCSKITQNKCSAFLCIYWCISKLLCGCERLSVWCTRSACACSLWLIKNTKDFHWWQHALPFEMANCDLGVVGCHSRKEPLWKTASLSHYV